MPIYDFACQACGEGFEELTAAGAGAACPSCGSTDVERRWSQVAPPGRLPRGAGVRDSEARRGEREAARTDRLAEARRARARGETPPGAKRRAGS